MSSDFYIDCDRLEDLPLLNKNNWLFETELLERLLTKKSKVLQVGCMDGTRIIALLKKRPDLVMTGLDIEKRFLKIAEKKLRAEHFKAEFIEADITKSQLFELKKLESTHLSLSLSQEGENEKGCDKNPPFDYVICLNNTLGYIPDKNKALQNMQHAGRTTIVSVYGESFTNAVGIDYFNYLKIIVEKVEHNIFYTREWGPIKRFTRDEVDSWRGEITVTPLGYFVQIR